ncbi:hypothetical protein XENOCAPTIV_011283 [Xenoophorus captivus]|uniref:Rho-GAP domain-containing protein n=1 Tax=Xenoophorus captivus TaxID=1517983 RepID=A0ABV0S9A7_9TELE
MRSMPMLLTAAAFVGPQNDEEVAGHHFGVRVCHLVSEKNPVPMVLEIMLEHVEMHGLYTEGIYRKSGAANRMKELHQRLETANMQCLSPSWKGHFVPERFYVEPLGAPRVIEPVPLTRSRSSLSTPEPDPPLFIALSHCRHLPLRFSAPNKGVVVRIIQLSGEVRMSSYLFPYNNVGLFSLSSSSFILREELAFRLPEMEQPGSDQENLDSEASLSSESLLDEQQQRSSAHSSEPEGHSGVQLRRHRPVFTVKPSDLAQRPKAPGGRPPLGNLTPSSSTSSLSSCASTASETSNTSFRHPLQRRNPIIPDTVKLPQGIVPQQAATSSRQTFPPIENRTLACLIRKRDQPGRRKDSTQSLYLDNPECGLLLHFASCPPSASSSSSSIATATLQQKDIEAPKGHRRFSDPDIPYMDDDV